MRLASRLTLIILASLLPLAAVAAYNSYSLYQARRTELDQTAIRQAQLTASELNRILERIWGIARTASQSTWVQPTQSPECSAFLKRVVDQVPYLTSIATADTAGRITCSTTSPLPAVTIAERGYFQVALAEQRSVVGEFPIRSVRFNDSVVAAGAIQ